MCISGEPYQLLACLDAIGWVALLTGTLLGLLPKSILYYRKHLQLLTLYLPFRCQAAWQDGIRHASGSAMSHIINHAHFHHDIRINCGLSILEDASLRNPSICLHTGCLGSC